MYARIAKFEGGDPARIDQEVEEMRKQMADARESGLPADAPEGMRTLMETVSRFINLVDRKTGASVGISFCETEEDMRRADEALNQMSPPDDGSGSRTRCRDLRGRAGRELQSLGRRGRATTLRARDAVLRGASRPARRADRHPLGERDLHMRTTSSTQPSGLRKGFARREERPTPSRPTEAGRSSSARFVRARAPRLHPRSSATRTSTSSHQTRSTSGSRRPSR